MNISALGGRRRVEVSMGVDPHQDHVFLGVGVAVDSADWQAVISAQSEAQLPTPDNLRHSVRYLKDLLSQV